MTNPLVSIIIPCYQSASTVEETLSDIFKQSYTPIEVVVVNDGSTDDTESRLQSFRPRLVYIPQANAGAAAARNAGFNVSHGEFILFCDADVRLASTMISEMVHALLNNPSYAYCYSNFKFGLHTFDLFPFDADRLKKENYISTMSLIRHSRFIGFDESLVRFQDWDLWKRMLQRGDRGYWINKRLFSAPMRRGGISSYSFTSLAKLALRRIRGLF